MRPNTGNKPISRNPNGIIVDRPGRGPGFFGFRSGLDSNVRPFVISDEDIYLRPSYWQVEKNAAIDKLFSSPQKDDMTCTLLGMPGDEHSDERRYFFSKFSWFGVDLLDSLRDLCEHLYLRAESQNLERVLDMLSARWLFCNPTSILESKDTVHTLAYSLLMLNTDLHGSDLEESRKMTCEQFCNNTMSVLSRTGHIQGRTTIRSLLSKYYSQIESSPLALLEDPPKRRQSYVQRTATTVREKFKNNNTTDAKGTIKEDVESSQSQDGKSSPCLSVSKPVTKVGRFKIISDTTSSIMYDPTTVYSVSISGDGCLNISDSLNKRRSLIPVFSNDNLSSRKASLGGRKRLATISLSQSLTTQDENSPHQWSLESKGLITFECSEEEEDGRDFVFACNYWAARMSKPPLREAITNINYGWHGGDSETKVAEWSPPVSIMSNAILPIGLQLDSLKAFLNRLRDSDIKQHEDLKLKIQKTYPIDSTNYTRAMNNWEKKHQYLERLQVRFSCYLDTLSNI